MITHGLRKRFVKDYRLPITIVRDPYFEYFIDTYTHMYAREKYDKFISLVEKLGSEEAFFAESSRIISEVIDSIKSTDAWKDFQTFDMNQFAVENNFRKNCAIYSPHNDGMNYISVDLVKANFQSLKFFNPEIVSNKESYEEFIKKFSDESYYIDSKQIRQVIFGNTNPKRQQTIQRFVMDKVWNTLEEQLECEIVGATSDEVMVYLGKNGKNAITLVTKILEEHHPELKFHVKQFKLNSILNNTYFKRTYIDGSWDLKGVPAHYYAEVFKHVIGQEVSEYDRYTFYDGRIVKFISPIFEEKK